MKMLSSLLLLPLGALFAVTPTPSSASLPAAPSPTRPISLAQESPEGWQTGADDRRAVLDRFLQARSEIEAQLERADLELELRRRESSLEREKAQAQKRRNLRMQIQQMEEQRQQLEEELARTEEDNEEAERELEATFEMEEFSLDQRRESEQEELEAALEQERSEAERQSGDREEWDAIERQLEAQWNARIRDNERDHAQQLFQLHDAQRAQRRDLRQQARVVQAELEQRQRELERNQAALEMELEAMDEDDAEGEISDLRLQIEQLETRRGLEARLEAIERAIDRLEEESCSEKDDAPVEWIDPRQQVDPRGGDVLRWLGADSAPAAEGQDDVHAQGGTGLEDLRLEVLQLREEVDALRHEVDELWKAVRQRKEQEAKPVEVGIYHPAR